MAFAPHEGCPRTLLILGLMVLVAAACGEANGGAVGVDVGFDPGAPRTLRDDAERVEVYVVEDCEEVVLGNPPGISIASTFTLRDGGMGPLGGEIELGDYGLYALAQDADCAVVAAACTPVTIDGSASLQITLTAFDGAPCDVNEEQCVIDTGRCEPTGNILCFGKADETACLIDEVSGTCWQEQCCTGCWDGTECRPGNHTQQCGSGGAMCEFMPGCSD